MNFPTFMNSALAWGALAFCVPLILHIMNRSRFKRVEWGAMHLLESVVKVNHKRFRLEQWILLLVRCAIPALLAFALARPVLTGAKTPAGQSPVSLVVLLDNSYSMDAAAGGVNRFTEAIDAACAMIEAVPRGSEVAVIQMGGVPTPLFDKPVFDPAAVVRKLRTSQAEFGAIDVRQSLDAGLATLSGMTHARREMVVISDFQSADWKSSDAIQTLPAQVAAMDVSPELTLLQTTGPAQRNVTIESLDFSTRPLGIGQPLHVRAGLRNFGESEVQNVRLVLKVDGTEQSVAQISLGANATGQTLFICEFATPGSHVIEVEARVDDSLAADNKLSAVVTALDQIDVLLVDGDRSSEPLKSETDFLSIALTPYTFSRLKLSDLVQTRTVSAGGNLKAEFQSGPQVIVLANVSKLTDAQCNALRGYVQGGGALLVCAGGRIDTDWYNKELFSQRGLLPAAFGLPKGKIGETGQTSRIVAQHFDHPALEFFNQPANGDLSTAEIRQWYELLLPEKRSSIFTTAQPLTRVQATDRGRSDVVRRGEAEADVRADETNEYLLAVFEGEDSEETLSSNVIVVARLDNGDPLLVEKSLGDGVVMQLATSCDADWSDLPLRPFYVPLMQQIIMTLATQQTPPTNISTGDAAVAVFDAPSESKSGDSSARPAEGSSMGLPESVRLSMTTPEGIRRPLYAVADGDRLVARFEGTNRPGVYTMTGPDGQSRSFAATASRRESDLTTLQEGELSTVADGMNAHVVASADEYLEQDRLRRNGREIWRYVLMALLVFMFLELVLQQRFSRVRS